MPIGGRGATASQSAGSAGDLCGSAYRYLLMRLKAGPGMFAVHYDATVDIDHHTESPGRLDEVQIAQLPPAVLPYIFPSRYCQSDRLCKLATREFGH